MAVQTAVFVSKRLQPPVAALLCLMAMQLMTVSLSSCHEEPLPMGAVRAALSHR
jgi:hypothetical protein